MQDDEHRWPEQRPGQGLSPRQTAAPFPAAGQPARPASSGRLLKSPFPMPPGAPIRQQTQQRPPAQDNFGEDLEVNSTPPRRGNQRRGGGFAPPTTPGTIRRQKPQRMRTTVLKVVLSLFLLASCSSLAYLGAKLYRVYRVAQQVTSQTLPTVTTKKNGVQATPLPSDLTQVSAFNLLLLGSDNDSKPQFKNAVLTQTDIVVHIDLAQHKVTMVSIPRDLWVNNDTGACCLKLDEISGNSDGLTDPLLAKKHGFAHTEAAIEADFGIPINAYAWVGLDGFVKVIDTLGGVDVDVLHPIIDDAYPNDLNGSDPFGYKRLDIPAGPQHLDGVTALEYVRSRHSDGTGDFGRSARQQSVLVALKKKLNNPAILTQLDTLAGDMAGSVLTDLSINQAIQLAQFAKDLKSTDIAQVVLSVPDYGKYDCVPNCSAPTYTSIVRANWPAIHQKLKQIFPDAAATVNLTKPSATDSQTNQPEGAHILIENGSGMTGVASKLASILKNDGFTVLTPQDADRVYLATQLEQFSTSTTGTARILEQMLGVLAQSPGTAGPTGADIVIIIGKDTANAIMQA